MQVEGQHEVAILRWTTGARVSNAYATYPVQGDSPEKFGLIPHNDIWRHLQIFKVSTVRDGHA